MTNALTVGFLGLGTMGGPMAACVARAGFRVRGWSRRYSPRNSEMSLPPGFGPPMREELRARGVTLVDSPRAAAEGSDVVITIVSDGAAVRSVLLGPAGAAENASGKVFVDMSTSGPAFARSLAQELEARGARFVDAPVSGSRGPAERGELLVLAGGEAKDIERVEPVLSSMARKIIRAGAVGSGQALKVVLNGLGAQHLVAFASMLHLGLRAGLSREAIVDAFTSGTFATPAYVSKRDRVLAGDYTGADFTLDLALKDVQLCAELAREVSMTIAQHERAREEIEKGVAAGLGGFDLYALERIYEQS